MLILGLFEKVILQEIILRLDNLCARNSLTLNRIHLILYAETVLLRFCFSAIIWGKMFCFQKSL